MDLDPYLQKDIQNIEMVTGYNAVLLVELSQTTDITAVLPIFANLQWPSPTLT